MSEQVREPTEPSIPPSGRLVRRLFTFCVFVAITLALNFWYDYYHPLGILFDIALAVGLFIWYLTKSKPV